MNVWACSCFRYNTLDCSSQNKFRKMYPMSDASRDHKKAASEDIKRIPYAVITASDSRTPDTDASGKFIIEAMDDNPLLHYEIVRDEPDLIGGLLDSLTEQHETLRIILVNGGTGIAPRDNTFDAVSNRLEKVMPGFGEIFRMLSYDEIGSAAMLSRAVAGVYRGVLVVSMPGSPNAVKLAMNRLILPELEHLAWEVAGRTSDI
jgi:molybdenum cofactor biosynthesis protein B